MKKKTLFWLLGGFAGIIALIYILFLLLPVIFIPFSAKTSSLIKDEIYKATKFNTEINGLSFLTTPKLTAGAGVKYIKVTLPNGSTLFEAKNIQIKASLLPVIFKKLQLDLIQADSIKADIVVAKDGHYLIEDYLVNEDNQNEKTETDTDENTPASFSLPYGFKLSDKLPDIKIYSHDISFVDQKTSKRYSLQGKNTIISDFIFNKKIKVKSQGSLQLDDSIPISYDIKVVNKIMPDLSLNDFLIQQQEIMSANQPDTEKSSTEFNIIDSFETLKKIGLSAKLNADVKVSGTLDDPSFNGNVSLDEISLLSQGKKLPNSNIKAILNKNKIDIDTNLYTLSDENTKLKALIVSGKNPKITLKCTSNARLNSIIRIVDSVMNVFGINDFKTLSATGRFDINFDIDSDFKNLKSNGSLKLSEGILKWDLYQVKLDKLLSNIVLDNNSVIIDKLGFSAYSVPFEIKGKISDKADCDITVTTSKMPLKALLVSLGQGAILKDNAISSGLISLDALVSGKLDAPRVSGNLNLDNLRLKNIPSNIDVQLNPLNVHLNADMKGYEGKISVQNFAAINPAFTFKIPTLNADIDTDSIVLAQTQTVLSNNNIAIQGKISDYLKEKIALDFKTSGGFNSTLSGNVNLVKSTLDLKYQLNSGSSLIIPGFPKSKLTAGGSLAITGNLLNPVLTGTFDVDSINIPEIPVSMKNLFVNLNGHILNGNATAENFSSGGIKASAIKTDFSLKDVNFFLKDLTGSAFAGTFEGNIVYNLSNAFTSVKFKGIDMDALSAVEGTTGIKNALSGKLKFDADLSLKALDYDTMMKSMKGGVSFEISDGTFMNVGSLKSFLNAQNLLSYTSLINNSAFSFLDKASQFDSIKGKLTFNGGYANLSPVTSQGPSMAYYISGKYNLLNGLIYVTVLGRLSDDIVSKMGSIGDFASDKITSVLPQLKPLISKVKSSITISPSKVDTSVIPSLRSADTKYKDFRVELNGNPVSKSSVKSFKWIADPDTSAIDAQLKEELNTLKETAKSDLNNAVQKVLDGSGKLTKEDLNKTKESAKELFKTLMGN